MASSLRILSGAAAARWIEERSRARVDEEAQTAVRPILADVLERGDAALVELTERFDGVHVESLAAGAEERRRALDRLGPERRSALEAARDHVEVFHRAQRRTEARVEVRPGVELWREFRPIERVGIYVPGGRADYPSSVLMCGVPARIAGCRSIVACTPPRPDGRAPDSVLAAAELLGLDAVYVVGGAQAIAALAYGTATIEPVDKIFGPGNRYVTAAKERVYGLVDIDMPAGPSEIVVLADGGADPRWAAADLISQAEHAPDALAVALTDDPTAAHRIVQEVEAQLDNLPEPNVARQSLSRSAVCVATDLDTAIAWANRLGVEHLEILTRDDEAVLARIENAGSVFLGPHSPVAAGDYATGGNHVLPTANRSRSWSALSLDDFGRWMLVQRVDRRALGELTGTVTTLARWEGFEAHARAIEIRFEERS